MPRYKKSSKKSLKFKEKILSYARLDKGANDSGYESSYEDNGVKYVPKKKLGKGGFVEARELVAETDPLNKKVVLAPNHHVLWGFSKEEMLTKLAFWRALYPLANVQLFEMEGTYRLILPLIPGKPYSDCRGYFVTKAQQINLMLSAIAAVKDCHEKDYCFIDFKGDNLHYDAGSGKSYLLDGGLSAKKGGLLPLRFKHFFAGVIQLFREKEGQIAPECHSFQQEIAQESMDIYGLGHLIINSLGDDFIDPALYEVVHSCVNVDPQQRPNLTELEERIKAQRQNVNSMIPVQFTNAARDGDLATINRLLSQGTDVNAKDKNKSTALIWASCFGRFNVVEILLQHNPDVNVQNRFGSTALSDAVEQGHLQVVQKLCAVKDIDLSIRKNGKNVLDLAMEKSNIPIVNTLLLKICDLEPAQQQEILSKIDKKSGIWKQALNSQLIVAARNGNLCQVQALLKLGADANAKDENGSTALIWASFRGRLEVVEVLLRHNPDINLQNKFGSTALSDAVEQGHLQIVQRLCAVRNIDLSIRKNGKNVLDLAIEKKNLPIIKALLLEIHRLKPEQQREILSKVTKNNNMQAQALPAPTMKFAQLHEKLDALAKYAQNKMHQTTNGSNTNKGYNEIAQLSTALKEHANSYTSALQQDDFSSLVLAMHEFNCKLKKLKNISVNETSYTIILANISIAATGVGLLLITANFLMTGSLFVYNPKSEQEKLVEREQKGLIEAVDTSMVEAMTN